MRGNVHPNPCPIFSCSVCAGNVPRGLGQYNAEPAPNRENYGASFFRIPNLTSFPAPTPGVVFLAVSQFF